MQKKVFFGVVALAVVVAATSIAVNADRPRLMASSDTRTSIPTVA